MASSKSFIPQDAVKAYNELNAALERNNEVLGKHFAELQKVAGEFSKVSVSQKDLLAAITRYEQVVRQVNSTQTEQARIASELEKWEQKIAFAKSEEGKRLNQLKVDYQAINRETTIASKMASAYTTTLTKLINAQEQANIAAQKYKETLGVESKEYKNAVADAKRYEQEIAKLEMETGRLTAKKTSMYGATFQLTQVMRELPNFAMDARIGFMALSNNLPMLADSFSMLSKQINEVTGKPYGAAGAFKIFAKSLLSMNTVLIAASTLLIMFGDKIMEVFTGKVSAAEQAHRDFIKSLEEGNNEIVNTFSELTRLRAILNNVDGVYITAKDAIDEYNKVFGETAGIITEVSEGQERLNSSFEDYLELMVEKQYIDLYTEQLGKIRSEISAMEKELDKGSNRWENAHAYIQNLIKNPVLTISLQGSFGGGFGSIQRTGRELLEAEKRIGIDEKKQELEDGIEELNKLWDDFLKKFREKGFDYLPNKDKDGKSAAKTLRTIFIELDAYSKERQRLTEEMKRAEEASEKETASSTVNAYESREQAMRRYYEASKKLADLDYNEAVAKAEQELNKEKERIEKAREYNQKALDAGKATEEEYAEASAKLLKAEENAEANYNTAVLKAHDDRLNAMYDLDVDYRQKLSALWDDIAEDASYEASRPTGLSTVSQGIGGYQPNTELAELRAAHEEKMRLIDEEIERRKKAGEDVTAFEIDKINELNEYKKQSERSAQEQLQEIEVEIVETTYNMLKDLAASYYEAKLEANEEWAEKENERVDAQVKSEVISEEQAEAQRQAIENQREQREKEIKRKQAISERAFAAFEIGLNTAAAIMQAAKSVAPPWNVPLIAAMATLGAAQLAAVLATPIPQYAHGTEDHPGGLAVVGEAGKHELVVLPDGTLLKTPRRPTLLDLPPHAEVLPDFAKAIPDILTPPTSKDKYSVTIHEDGRLVELTKQNNKLLRMIAAKDTVIVNKQARNYNMRN